MKNDSPLKWICGSRYNVNKIVTVLSQPVM